MADQPKPIYRDAEKQMRRFPGHNGCAHRRGRYGGPLYRRVPHSISKEKRCNAVSETNGNGEKLSRLLKQLKDAEEKLAAEKLRQAKREKKETKKLEGIIGAAILKELRALQDGTAVNQKEAEALETILRGILQSVASMFSVGERKLLHAKGLLP
jgi:hypothetical protein